ncbi:MAG: sigma-70 family RNA polymerase sigma factor [Bacteroidota bacterium]
MQNDRMPDEKGIIDGCLRQRKDAQLALFSKYAPLFRAICLRYAGNRDDAEDMLQEGFIKIFTKIRQYRGEGSFEGWMKRIVINTALTGVKKKAKHFGDISIDKAGDRFADEMPDDSPDQGNARSVVMTTEFSREELLSVINSLPDGYRMVFNLYVIDEYSHNEIASMLNISESTSKSQFSRARKLLQKKLFDLGNEKM